MERLPLAIWLLGWPVWLDCSDYLLAITNRPVPPIDDAHAGIALGIWVIGIVLTYPRRASQKKE